MECIYSYTTCTLYRYIYKQNRDVKSVDKSQYKIQQSYRYIYKINVYKLKMYNS